MKIDLGEPLVRLKQHLQAATDLMVPWDCFHDEVAMVPAYSFAGAVEDSERITATLAAAANHLVKGPWKVSHAHYVHLPEHSFWHGSCEVGPRTAIFFFFDDIDVGLAGYFRALTDPRVELVRLTVYQPLQPGYERFN